VGAGEAVRPYHHGDLRVVLVRVAVDLVRDGGPAALTLREVGRRAGVSANAAYRHFDGLPALREAVAAVGLDELTAAMQAEVAARKADVGDASSAARAVREFTAIGAGYVRFACEQPGLFAATFAASVPNVFFARTSDAAAHDQSPAGVLGRALHGLAAAGLMDVTDVTPAATTTWAGVHGLATLLQGPLGPVTGPDRQRLIDTTMAHLLRGVTGWQRETST
jgi:AcrR family transcriptional regulator